jgi:hypothetical protein
MLPVCQVLISMSARVSKPAKVLPEMDIIAQPDRPDSMRTIQMLPVPPLIKDSLMTDTPELIIAAPVIRPPADTIPKKPKGVKGLRDED